jgi:hypothetical protein
MSQKNLLLILLSKYSSFGNIRIVKGVGSKRAKAFFEVRGFRIFNSLSPQKYFYKSIALDVFTLYSLVNLPPIVMGTCLFRDKILRKIWIKL